MNLNSLSNRIEKAHVDSDNGWGEGVTFTPRATLTPVTGLRAMVAEGLCGDFNYDYKVDEDLATFLSFFSDTLPRKGDIITRDKDGTEYQVLAFVGSNPYDVLTRANSRHSANRSTRREK